MSDERSPTPIGVPQPTHPAPKPVSLKSRIRKNPLITVFSVLSGITILFALLVGIAQVLSLVFIKVLSLPGVVLRLYALFFAFIVILSELEVTKHIRESFLVTSWLCRGLFYVFVGTLVFELKPELNGTYKQVQDAYITGTSVSLIVLGILYFALGGLCVKRWRDGMINKWKAMLATAEMSDALRAEAGLLDSPGQRI